MYKRITFLFLFVSFCAFAQQKNVIVVSADKSIAKVSPSMWGIFFEDINFAADGGLYAELIKNRSFEFANPLMGWKTEGKGKLLVVNQTAESPNNARYITIESGADKFSLTNEGFRGIGYKANETYRFSLNGKLVSAAQPKITVQLLDADNQVISEQNLTGIKKSWDRISVEIKAAKTVLKGKIRLLFSGEGTVNLDLISLFPTDTWKGRPNGLRKDLVQKLADLKPGFVRFPGGCIVEGRDLANRYQWKETVGAPFDRKVMINRWNTEFDYRSAPDYFQTFGLGFYEYFLLSEDIGAKALPILNCGMACQFNTAEVVANTELDPYIQDAVDLVEFANGDTTTKWGNLRAKMGHPKPFNLDRIGIGNEQWGPQYIEKYKLFEAVLKVKCPNVQLVGAAGPGPSGANFDYAWEKFKSTGVDFMDEHYYMSPEWFLKNASRYDHYDRKGPKIFAGEFAAHDKEDKAAESRNTWLSALTEAAFMTGLERNADIVQMSSYAPLLAHVEAWQWRPDLIWFDNLNSIATPNYWVQKMYANYKGTDVLSVLSNGKNLTGQDSLYASAVEDKTKGQLIIKLVNAGASVKNYDLLIDAGKPFAKSAKIFSLQSDVLSEMNSIQNPDQIKPRESAVTNNRNKISLKIPKYSFSVIVLDKK
ncbi:alpha-L-arabinofuranosidase C-terminal domain-containing protein [Pedobacter aquatilis]|uniref:alpha-L-arabinofuranosidase C-terminal domain-containing protein n=1 Tax=Pedobacter aquatilis TaxID=351343 RepID=UPI00292F0AF5|nr:alpha-L-arabinofuranosidase C-terminal domain-containing protein [Pedobacter aquatilis]